MRASSSSSMKGAGLRRSDVPSATLSLGRTTIGTVLVVFLVLAMTKTTSMMTSFPTASVRLSLQDCNDSNAAADGILPDHRLAYDESLGFFDDIPSADWERQRAIALGRINYNAKSPRKGRVWYQNNFDPDFSCRHDTKVGAGDGGKWVCDPHRLIAQSRRRMEALRGENSTGEVEAGCLVYSVGSNGDFRFESSFADLVGNPGTCEIHTFDFTNYSHKVPPGKGVHFHAWGLKPSYNKRGRKLKNVELKNVKLENVELKNVKLKNVIFKTFKETMMELGHMGRPIDIFKIDCEGCEWSTYKDWIDADMRQILVEVHHVPEVADNFFQDLQRAGYVTFHKEPNTLGCGGDCVEYAMLKLGTRFVEERLHSQSGNETQTSQ